MDLFWLDLDYVEKFTIDVFKGLALPEEDSRICADVLVTANKRGIDSHGIARLKSIYYDRIKSGIQSPITRLEIIKEGPTTALIDGNNGMGQVIAKRAMTIAINKAKDYGLGMVAVKNSTHFGIAGYYGMMAAEAGLIGIVGTNARPSVAPTFGTENMLGTNPLAVGIPSDEEFPFIFDASTSLTHRGKVEVYNRCGKEIPKGWVIDRNGRYRTDTSRILEDFQEGTAALTPLGGSKEETGGHKGYGLATVVEILSSALQNGPYLQMLSGFQHGKRVPYRLGHFFIAINISSFIDFSDFKQNSGSILRALRSSRKIPGKDRIYTAGEKEYLTWKERKEKGIPLNKQNIQDLMVIRDELGLYDYQFPFDSKVPKKSG